MSTSGNNRSLVTAFAAGMVAFLLGATTVGIAWSQGVGPGVVAHVTPPAAAFSGATPIADIAERTLPSVVNIQTDKMSSGHGMSGLFKNPLFRKFFGRKMPKMGPQLQRARGSGVIISANGTILTNNHVIRGARTIRITTHDQREFKAKVVGADPKSDLAVLKPLRPISGLRPIKWGSSAKMRLGEVVLAIGNPFGVGQTVTMGIVSAKGRANVGIVDYEDFIQTDAAINPGNSGGALVNLRGELVGVPTAILSRSGGYQGIGFAIPSDMAKPIFAALLTHGKVTRGFLGINIQTLTPALAGGLGLTRTKGVLVSNVIPGTPAAQAGLQRGDVVIAIDGQAVHTSGRLRNTVASRGAGATVNLRLLRGGKLQNLTVKLGRLPGASAAAPSPSAPAASGKTAAGMQLSRLSSADRAKLGVPAHIRGGVLVSSVKSGSNADQAGLQAGDVILEVNRRRVSSPSQFSRRYRRASGQVLLVVYRRGGTMFLVLNK